MADVLNPFFAGIIRGVEDLLWQQGRSLVVCSTDEQPEKEAYYLPNHGEFHMLVHNAELAEKECGIPRENIFVCDAGDVVEFDHEGARKIGRVPVGGIMYDDSGCLLYTSRCV